MLDISLYLLHLAKKDDVLIIDEPELNLHPEKQREFARLLAYLSNIGLNIVITTHSDYILRELSNLVQLNSTEKHIVELRKKEKYDVKETLLLENISVYIAEKDIIAGNDSKKANIDKLTKVEISQEDGISRSCFDDVISIQSKIMDNIAWGGEE